MKINDNNYTLLGIISGFFMVGMVGTRPLIPIFAHELGATPFEIGIVVSMFPFLSLLFAVQIGKIVDRIGSKKPIILSSIIGSLSLVLPLFSSQLIGIILSQLIAGIANTFFVVSAQSYAGHSSSPIKREENILKFSIGAAIGSFVGPLLGGFLADQLTSAYAFLLLGMIGLFAALLSFSLTPFTIEKREKQPLGKFSTTFQLLKIRNVRRAFLISSLVLLGKDMFTAYFPLLGLHIGLSSTSIGMIVSINALAGIFIRWFMPQLIDVLGKRRVIVLSVVCSGGLFLFIPLFNHIVLLSFLSFLLGMGLGIGQPLSISTTLNSLPRERVAEGLGFRLTSNRLTQTVAPFAFGVVAQLFGLASVFFVTGAIVLLGSTKSTIDEQELKMDE